MNSNHLYYLICSIFLFGVHFSYSQNKRNKEKELEDYVVTNSNDTIYGEIYLGITTSLEAYDDKIKLKVAKGDTRTFRANDLKGFKIKWRESVYFAESHLLDDEKEKVFLYIEIDGEIKYYRSNISGGNGTSYAEKIDMLNYQRNNTAIPQSFRYVNYSNFMISYTDRKVRYYVKKEGGVFIEDRNKNEEVIELLFNDCEEYKKNLKELKKKKTENKILLFNTVCE